MLSYKEKYLKYKEKYINFKNTGGTLVEIQNCMHSDYYIDDIIQQINIYKKIISYIIEEIKLKQVITLDNFMYLEEILNYLYNIQSFIGYYKRILLLSMKQSPIINSKHNILYNILSKKDINKKKGIDDFIKDNITNELNIVINLIINDDLLKKLEQLLKHTCFNFKNKVTQKNLNIEKEKIQKEENFYEQQIIDILTYYIKMISKNIKNKLQQKIEDDSYKFINNLWIVNQKPDTSQDTKIINYRNILLKLYESAIKLQNENILSYHQNKENMNIETHEVLETILTNNLIIFKDNHLEIEQHINDGKKINTKEEYKELHKHYIEKKYGDIHNIINSNININNLIEGLRWIVYKYYNLLMKKSENCSGYREDINVYDFFDKTTGVLVGVVYFDINFDQPYADAYINEFRKRYNYNYIKVVPIICLYISFKELTLSEIKAKLFHEFGHTIHTILSQNYYQNLSPNKIRFDYVEIMSQFFELYIFEKEFINRFLVLEPIVVREIPDYDNLPQIKLYESINFENYFNESQNKFLNNIEYLLISLLEIKLKVLSKQELEQLDIIDYSTKFLQNLKTKFTLPDYVSYKTNVLEFERIYKYPLYYVYIISLLKVNEIRNTFGATLFDSVKTNIYINNILSKGNITDISSEINILIFKFKQI